MSATSGILLVLSVSFDAEKSRDHQYPPAVGPGGEPRIEPNPGAGAAHHLALGRQHLDVGAHTIAGIHGRPSTLNGITALGADDIWAVDVWAVGSLREETNPATLIEQWNGSAWRRR